MQLAQHMQSVQPVWHDWTLEESTAHMVEAVRAATARMRLQPAAAATPDRCCVYNGTSVRYCGMMTDVAAASSGRPRLKRGFMFHTSHCTCAPPRPAPRLFQPVGFQPAIAPATAPNTGEWYWWKMATRYCALIRDCQFCCRRCSLECARVTGAHATSQVHADAYGRLEIRALGTEDIIIMLAPLTVSPQAVAGWAAYVALALRSAPSTAPSRLQYNATSIKCDANDVRADVEAGYVHHTLRSVDAGDVGRVCRRCSGFI